MAGYGLELKKDRVHTLQVNVGLRCNQTCRHCHLEAGPHRQERMDKDTMAEVVAYARAGQFHLVDITGGAPELNPDLCYLLERLATVVPRLSLRSNLTALLDATCKNLVDLCCANNIAIIASLPAVNETQTEAQRGKGVWAKSMAALRMLNDRGYGQPGSGLELHLVANPAGAFLPSAQRQTEKKFKHDLSKKGNLVFNHLYTFANVPAGRFRLWLLETGNFTHYMEKLAARFNPATISGLMCRHLVSVSWDGFLFDCDFNQADGLFAAGYKQHVSQASAPPLPGAPIATGDHCYACTAGAGFT